MITDDDLLELVYEERRQSVGFESDQELSEARIRALDYYKGEMPDVPALANRSRAVSTDVADAVETVLPDLVEIFIGGEDTATFQPQSVQDEAAARQETDYVNHVILNENDGFLLFYTAFKDALLTKTGVFKWWWETRETVREEAFEGFAPADFAAVQVRVAQDPGTTLTGVKERADPATGLPLVDFTARYAETGGRARVQAVAPEDFTVARDTITLADATYCAMRSRPRAQDLIAEGYDRDKVAELPMYGAPSFSEEIHLARDTAGEQTNLTAGGSGDLRLVEIIEHFIRVVNPGGEPEIWRVVTGADSDKRLLLEREKVDRIPFASITPYPTAHRFYGRSVADLLLEIQRIKTALTRMLLDSGYFALNQRLQVDMTKANEFTIGDLLRNEPGVPIRTRGPEAVTPVSSAGLSFDAAGALEYFSTVAEGRTGIVRNAQGLNPDTLHDTASGALAMMSNAQKRVRMIARIFAETGVKALYLGVHALIRTHAERPDVVRLGGQWVAVDPTLWGERADMTIEIGIGSGGQQHELQAGAQALQVMQTVIQLQGGANGPLITLQNAYNFLKRFFERGLGIKSVDLILSDPSQAPPPMAAMAPGAAPPPGGGAPQPPQPHPAMVKVQADAQIDQARMTQDGQLAQMKMASDAQLKREAMAMEGQLKREQLQLDAQVKLIEARHRMAQTVQFPPLNVGAEGAGE
jgi:hypothetical protein